MTKLSALVIAFATAACTDDGDPTYGDDVASTQIPPRGSTDVQAWLEAGHYLEWTCESERHPARPGSPDACSKAHQAPGSAPAGTATITAQAARAS